MMMRIRALALRDLRADRSRLRRREPDELQAGGCRRAFLLGISQAPGVAGPPMERKVSSLSLT
jgi:hypothetical protein